MNKILLPGNNFDSQYIYALMTYPNDDFAQGKLIAVTAGYYMTNELASDQPITLNSELIKLIADSNACKTLLAESATNSIHGRIAGDVLVYLARMTLAGTHEPSKNKAILLAERRYATARYGNGQSVPSSRPKICEFWDEFSPVIHLWAAFNICSIPDTVHFIAEFDLNYPAKMSKFLGIAYWFKNFAENFTSSRQPTKRQIKEKLVPENILISFDECNLGEAPKISWSDLEDWMSEELTPTKSL